MGKLSRAVSKAYARAAMGRGLIERIESDGPNELVKYVDGAVLISAVRDRGFVSAKLSHKMVNSEGFELQDIVQLMRITWWRRPNYRSERSVVHFIFQNHSALEVALGDYKFRDKLRAVELQRVSDFKAKIS